MDSRLVLTVVLVTFAWMFVGTNAQSNGTSTNGTSTNGTTTNGTMTNGTMTNGTSTNGTTTNGTMTNGTMTNGTSTNGTTTNGTMTNGTSTNGTSTNGTTTNGTMTNGTMTNGTSTNGTTTNGTMTNGTTTNGTMTNGTMTNGTMTNGTTTNGTMTNGTMTNGTTTNGTMTNGTMTNGTTTNGTTTNGTMTTGAPSNGTTVPVSTVAPPLTPNTTVEPLQTAVSREGCGSNRLCAAQPNNCDPSVAGSCFFVSSRQMSGQNFMIQLSGETDGYIAASLSTDTTPGGNDTTYICARNNSDVVFFGALLDNNTLTLKTLNVNSVKARINGTTVQCTFAATVPSSTARATSAFSLSVSNGAVNSTSGALGSPTSQLRTQVIDLSNPKSNTTNQLNTTTTATTATTPTTATTTSHAVTLQQSLSHALLIVVGVLGLAMV